MHHSLPARTHGRTHTLGARTNSRINNKALNVSAPFPPRLIGLVWSVHSGDPQVTIRIPDTCTVYTASKTLYSHSGVRVFRTKTFLTNSAPTSLYSVEKCLYSKLENCPYFLSLSFLFSLPAVLPGDFYHTFPLHIIFLHIYSLLFFSPILSLNIVFCQPVQQW